MSDPRLRQLTIKTGVVKRLTKERSVYEKEIEVEKNRLEKFKANGSDEHILKKQQEVIQECQMMLPVALKRLKAESEELENFLKNEEELKETKEYETAALILSEAKEAISKA